jgi:hypothetical protein
MRMRTFKLITVSLVLFAGLVGLAGPAMANDPYPPADPPGGSVSVVGESEGVDGDVGGSEDAGVSKASRPLTDAEIAILIALILLLLLLAGFWYGYKP